MQNLTVADKPQPLTKSLGLPQATTTLPISASKISKLHPPSLLTGTPTLSKIRPRLQSPLFSTQPTTTPSTSFHQHLQRRFRSLLQIQPSTHPPLSKFLDLRNSRHATPASANQSAPRSAIFQQQVLLHSRFLLHTRPRRNLQ